MSKMPLRVYIAGPIAGKPNANRAAFSRAVKYVERRGHMALNPHTVKVVPHLDPCPEGPPGGEGSEHTAPCYMRHDIIAMLNCDAIYLLRGWEYSIGARTEFEVARSCGLKIFYQDKGTL